MIKKTYQWPNPFDYQPKYYNNIKGESEKDLYSEIENYFINQFNIDAILVPSGRAGIAMLLRYFQIDRSKIAFVSKWSSHCMFNTLGAFTNVTVDLSSIVDFVVINHQWGRVVEPKIKHNESIYIEDSVDSIHLSSNSFFPNDTDFEIISLPKIIGSYSGGIIFNKDPLFAKEVRELQKQNISLAKHQSRCKTIKQDSNGDNFDTWLYYESWNTAHDISSLFDIKEKIKNYEKNKSIIMRRIAQTNEIDANIKIPDDRLGPVLIFPMNYFKKCDLKYSEILHYSWNEYIEEQKYEKVITVPIHMGITNDQFNKFIKLLKKGRK